MADESKTLDEVAGEVVDIVLSYQGAGIGGPHVAVKAAIQAAVADAERTGFCNGIVWTEKQKTETLVGSLETRAQAAERKLADPWDLEGNAAATAWKARVDAVQKWAEQEYGDASEFPTGLVFALFGSVAAELHEEKTDART